MEAASIKTVVVIGGGTMGQGIVQSFAQSGLSVRVVDLDKQLLDRSLAQVDANLRLFQEYGLLEEDIPAIKSRIQPVLTKDLAGAVQGCDFVVEAIPENLELKRRLFAQLDSCREEVILCSNTSSLVIPAIAEGCRTQGRIIGLHYFNPAHIMPLVEIHYGAQTKDEVIATTKALMLRVGKKPIVLKKEVPGFVINRLQVAIGREIFHLIDEGVVSNEDMEMAGRACYGLRWACISFLESLDMIGLDVAMAVVPPLFKTLHNGTETPTSLVEKVEKGELGVKSGKGLLDYTGKSTEEILDSQNRRLLKQLALFKELDV